MIRSLLLTGALGALLLPAISHTSTQSEALGACTRAFAASMAAPGSSAPAFKLIRTSEPESAIDDYYTGHEYTFYLQAHDLRTGATVASANCTADARASQVALTAAPADGPEATLGAR